MSISEGGMKSSFKATIARNCTWSHKIMSNNSIFLVIAHNIQEHDELFLNWYMNGVTKKMITSHYIHDVLKCTSIHSHNCNRRLVTLIYAFDIFGPITIIICWYTFVDTWVHVHIFYNDDTKYNKCYLVVCILSLSTGCRAMF
jgi:hypothetical protein